MDPFRSMPRGAWAEVLWVVASNAFVLAFAIRNDWAASLLFWPYWIQSVAIGYLARRRMLALRAFSTDGLRIKGRRVPETEEGKREAVSEFITQYTIVHLFYMAILLAKLDLPEGELRWVLLGGATFVLGNWLGERRALIGDAGRKPRLDALRRLPYLRVFTMHFSIILVACIDGSWNGMFPLVGFTLLKTTFDVLMAVYVRIVEAGFPAASAGNNENGRPQAPVVASQEAD